MFGTYAYMPPEQVDRMRGGATVKFTTDIFSFGVLAYQLLTGYLPFGQLESHNDLAKYQYNGKRGLWNREALSHLPDGQQWERVIEGCLVPNYKNRLQNVDEVMRLVPLRDSVYTRNVAMRPQSVSRATSPTISPGITPHWNKSQEDGRLSTDRWTVEASSG